MLDLRRLERHTLRPTPWGQVLFARVLRLDYRFPRRTEIVLEGVEHLDPRRRYILAMNHTDRYNYWPLQLALYQRKLGFTTTWVKGKYYESDVSGWFMDAMGQLPMPSRGYVITTCFRDRTGRPPSREEYRALRDVADGKRTEVPPELQRLLGDAGAFLSKRLPRDCHTTATLLPHNCHTIATGNLHIKLHLPFSRVCVCSVYLNHLTPARWTCEFICKFPVAVVWQLCGSHVAVEWQLRRPI